MAAVPLGLFVLLLGAWVFIVPLVGPYFDFGFFTSHVWVFSALHWELLLGPGIALFVGGLLILLPAGGPSSLGGLLALLAGAWLLVGPSLHPIWSSEIAVATHHPQWLTSVLWIGYFYGTGAVAVYLSGVLHGLLGRRPVAYPPRTAIEDAPLERERTYTRT
ncbi:MAG TPA: hypothetical protein VE995_03755 [Gaiellaceae bacterium]|nr:hypothetical protein [Gaiellaceae bacterium]